MALYNSTTGIPQKFAQAIFLADDLFKKVSIK